MLKILITSVSKFKNSWPNLSLDKTKQVETKHDYKGVIVISKTRPIVAKQKIYDRLMTLNTQFYSPHLIISKTSEPNLAKQKLHDSQNQVH